MRTRSAQPTLFLAIATLGLTTSVRAEDFRWEQAASGTYNWEDSGSWMPYVPVDSTHEDNFFFLEHFELSDGTAVIAHNDLANPTLARDLRLMGMGPLTGSATFDITGHPIKIGGTEDRFIHLLADTNPDASFAYNIHADIQGTHAIQFVNDGTATYNFFGQISPRLDSSGDTGVSKNGSSTIRLHSSQSFNNKEFNHLAGTVELVDGAKLTSNRRYLLRASTLAVSGADTSINILENNAGVGTLQIAEGLILDITTAQATTTLKNTDANRIRVTGGGTLRATDPITPANFAAPLHLEGAKLELTRDNNWAHTQSISLQDGAALLTAGFDNAFDRLELRGGESFIDFAPGAAGSALSFGDVRSSAWTAGSTLTLLNWQGSSTPNSTDSGEGYLRFSKLTSDQLEQIRFLNPHGFPEGHYAAQSVEVDGFSYIVPLP